MIVDNIKAIGNKNHEVYLNKLRLVGLTECAFADDLMVCEV